MPLIEVYPTMRYLPRTPDRLAAMFRDIRCCGAYAQSTRGNRELGQVVALTIGTPQFPEDSSNEYVSAGYGVDYGNFTPWVESTGMWRYVIRSDFRSDLSRTAFGDRWGDVELARLHVLCPYPRIALSARIRFMRSW